MTPDSPWFARAFERAYLQLYAHRDASDAARAIDFAVAVVGLDDRTRALDLACGAGRHLAVLAPKVGRAVGLDFSMDLLERARSDLKGARTAVGARIGLVRADMRRLPLADAAFDLVLNLFTSFGYFEAEAENRAVLAEVARVLAPEGRFVLDHIHPPHLERTLVPESRRELDGGAIVVERRSFDRRTRRIEKEVVWLDPGEPGPTSWTESVRVFDPEELDSMLASAGLRAIQRYGDFDASPLSDASPRQIVLAARER